MAMVSPIVLYGCKTVTWLQDEINRLQAVEMWLWRGLEKIRCSDRISNDEVLTIVNEERCLIETMARRKKNWIEHVLREDGLLRDVLEGIMVGKKRTFKPREGMISDLEKAISNLKIKKEISNPKEGEGDKAEGEERDESGSEEEEGSEGEERKENKTKKRKKKNDCKH